MSTFPVAALAFYPWTQPWVVDRTSYKAEATASS